MEHHWEESLDVDDSDLHTHTLRPCKQQRCGDLTTSITTTTTTTAATTAANAYISQSQTLDSSPSASQTAISLPLNLTSTNQAESPPQPHTIPGPAGIVQAAKLRKSRDIANYLAHEQHPMATQEYIRKVVEDPEEDEDFRRNPWLSAVEFVHADGMFNSASSAHLGEINKCQENGKLIQVVAVIKSCTPNGLGDMMVTLKDPTGTVSGTIHHKVLTEGDFGKGICVGSVLILHKVSVVSPSRSTHYLNITKRNLVKVFYKDGGSSQKQTFHETINSAPHSDLSSQDSGQGTPLFGSVFSLERGAEGIVSRMKRSNNNNEQENMSHINTTNKDTNMNLVKVFYKDGGSSQTQPFHGTINAAPHSDLLSQDSGHGTPLSGSAFSLERGAQGIMSRMKRSSNNNEQENMSYTNTTNKDTNQKIARDKETLKESNVIENVGQMNERHTNGFEEIKALLPGWTDEQLHELAVWDDN